MRRRHLLAMLGSSAVAWTLGARAQKAAIPVVGFLNSASPDNYAFNAAAFREGLRETGYVDGQNVTLIVVAFRPAVLDNAIGITLNSTTLSAKREELLREIAPSAALIACS